MAKVELKIDVRGMRRMLAILDRLSKKAQSRTDLHARWAILALNWIDKNFRSEGGMVGRWKPLSPNTLAARRKGSGRILQDTGGLKGSFVPSWTSEYASVGSPLDIALYHEKGTGPYIIRPKKPGGRLKFQVATETGVRTKMLRSGKELTLRYAKGDYIFVKEVHHPGLPIRRMLPQQGDASLAKDLLRAAGDYLRAKQEVGEVKD